MQLFCHSLLTFVFFRAAGAAEEDGVYGAISVTVLFIVLGFLLALVVLYKRSVNRKIAKKDGGSFTGARYQREPFGDDLGTVEMNPRGDVEEEEGEAMEMQEMPRGVVDALAQVHADAERGDPDGIEEVDDNASDDENGEFVNPIARLNIESTS